MRDDESGGRTHEGQVVHRMGYHPLAFVVMLQIAVGVVLWTAVGAGLIRRDLTHVLQWVLVIDLVALLTVWVLRIVTGMLPA